MLKRRMLYQVWGKDLGIATLTNTHVQRLKKSFVVCWYSDDLFRASKRRLPNYEFIGKK